MIFLEGPRTMAKERGRVKAAPRAPQTKTSPGAGARETFLDAGDALEVARRRSARARFSDER